MISKKPQQKWIFTCMTSGESKEKKWGDLNVTLLSSFLRGKIKTEEFTPHKADLKASKPFPCQLKLLITMDL